MIVLIDAEMLSNTNWDCLQKLFVPQFLNPKKNYEIALITVTVNAAYGGTTNISINIYNLSSPVMNIHTKKE